MQQSGRKGREARAELLPYGGVEGSGGKGMALALRRGFPEGTEGIEKPGGGAGLWEVVLGGAFYRFSAFFRELTRRRETGIFSSTPFRVSSRVPPETDSISSTMDRFTR